ncbi:hypothetical protein [Oscillibacter sp.]|uniref:hypothetical protein n=1 Tax=Oscillibacter sp. TaxID=1945593 RepID=UPI00289A98F4|nr:hypothetical protein [Oscillibacter sp.]
MFPATQTCIHAGLYGQLLPLPSVLKLNQELNNKMNIFPIKDFHETTPVVVSYL